MKKKVMSIFGTRPEAIKMLPLVKEMEKRDGIDSMVCVTAQHRQMLDQVLEIFNHTPDMDLDIMKDRQTLVNITTRVLEGLDAVMKEQKPDMVLVHGDTSTTFAASLAAFYNQIPIGHVEAGLRTYNKYEPFPEEMNRRLTGGMADVHFCPTEYAKTNLTKENVNMDHVFITGNTGIDSLSYTLDPSYRFSVEAVNGLDFHKKVIVVTAHRRENWGKNLENICHALLRLANDFDDVEIIYAVHKNPVVVDTVQAILGSHERVLLTDPLDLKDMHNLMHRAYLIMTDSGGLQEEAPSLNKPVVVLRNVTERPEGVETGALYLAGVEEENVYRWGKTFLTDAAAYQKACNAVNPFGDGKASERITNAILYYFGMGQRPEDFLY